MTAEDRDSRLRAWARKIVGDVIGWPVDSFDDENAAQERETADELVPLLSDFADEVTAGLESQITCLNMAISEEQANVRRALALLAPTCDDDPLYGAIKGLLAQVEELRGELASVDDRLARRPALDHLPDRLAKIERCISAAAVTDPNDEIGKLQRRVSDLERERAYFEEAGIEAQRERDGLKERVGALKKALRKHGQHSHSCDWNKHCSCTCGFAAALQGTEPKPEKP